MKIICVEANNLPIHQNTPQFFLKPDTCLLRNNQDFYYPNFTRKLVAEVGLVVRINKIGRSISSQFASRYYNELGIGINLTAQDLFENQQKAGQAWDISKVFDYSFPLSSVWIPIEPTGQSSIQFRLDINQQTVQQGSYEQLFPFDTSIAYLSQYISLKIGDLIFSGTAIVNPLQIGDQVQAFIASSENNEWQKLMEFQIK